MRLQRLQHIGIAEIAHRSRQEVSKWLERARANEHMSEAASGISRALASRLVLAMVSEWVPNHHVDGVARGLLKSFTAASRQRFFDGPVDQQTPALVMEQVPGVREHAVRYADAVCRQQFDLLGYRGLDFGNPVDWHLDPISQRRAPLLHWSLLNPLDSAVVGDAKVIWELNRHQWLVRLGQAYRLTGDERYAAAFGRFMWEWMLANPPGIGINWASSLEVALRIISWCWTLFLFRGSTALSPELFVGMLAGIATQASHVEKYLSSYHSPNTHLTGEALGLFYAAVVFPELAPAKRWRALAQNILRKEIERQVFSDGVYFEQSTCYHRYTVEIYLHFLMLAARNGIARPSAMTERVQRMLDFLVSVRRPDGCIPAIGDGDGGCLLPLSAREPDDCSGVFSTAAAIFSRSDYAWAAGGLAAEALWLLGSDGLTAWENLPATPPARPAAGVFPVGGYVIMRSGWEETGHQLIFDVGPLGCPISGGHGHADLLSIQCSAFGTPYLVDPGTYCYAADADWRAFCRSTAAHSTVRVDDVEQAIAAGPFGWEKRPRARLRRWLSTETFQLADAEHDAYARLHDPVIHRRQVLFLKRRYWVVVDDLSGAAEHRIELRFQFAPVHVEVDESLWARACGPDGHGLFIRPFAAVAVTSELVAGNGAPLRGWVCPDYGRREAAPVLTYSAVAVLPLRIVTLIYPIEAASAEVPRVSALSGPGPEPAGLVFPDERESVRLDALEPLIEHV